MALVVAGSDFILIVVIIIVIVLVALGVGIFLLYKKCIAPQCARRKQKNDRKADESEAEKLQKVVAASDGDGDGADVHGDKHADKL